MEAAIRSSEVNPAKLAMLYRRQFELCKVKPGETIACASHLATRREYFAAAFAAAYVLENGRIALSGPARTLAGDERIRTAYLGL
ncbi:MAG: hypothetical protein ACREEE_19010 [Dongiaceae bacterium]